MPRSDWRNIANGSEIPRENYSDQPYVVITRDGNWLCVLTTGIGKEGAAASTLFPPSAATKAKPGQSRWISNRRTAQRHRG